MKVAGAVLVVLGILMLAISGMNASNVPNISYLVGTFMPGLILLIVGLWMRSEKKKPNDVTPPESNP